MILNQNRSLYWNVRGAENIYIIYMYNSILPNSNNFVNNCMILSYVYSLYTASYNSKYKYISLKYCIH